MAHLLPMLNQQFFDDNGEPLVGGKLYSYHAGTSTPLATYQDAEGNTPNTNPIILDANGSAVIFVGPDSYKFVLTDPDDNVIWIRDGVSHIQTGSITTDKIADKAVTTAKLDDLAVTTDKIDDLSVTTGKIFQEAVTTEKIQDGSVTIEKIDPELDLTALAGGLQVVFQGGSDFDKGPGFRAIPQYPWVDPMLMTDIAEMPTEKVHSLAWSPNGEFLAVGYDDSPYFTCLQRFGTSFVELEFPGTNPGNPISMAWSPNGEFLAIGTTSSTHELVIYQRFGRKLYLVFRDDQSTTAINGLCWSPNGEYLAVTSTESAGIRIYQRSENLLGGSLTGTVDGTIVNVADVQGTDFGGSFSQTTTTNVINEVISRVNTQLKELQTEINLAPKLTTFTALSALSENADPATVDLKWSPDSKYLYIIIEGEIASFNIFEFDGDVFTKLTNPDLTLSTPQKMSLSQDGRLLVVGQSDSPYVHMFSVNGATLTALPALDDTPPGSVRSVAISPSGNHLAVGCTESPFLLIYKLTDDGFELLADADDMPTDDVRALAWSPDGQFLAVGYSANPYLHVYRTTEEFPDRAILYVKNIPRW